MQLHRVIKCGSRVNIKALLNEYMECGESKIGLRTCLVLIGKGAYLKSMSDRGVVCGEVANVIAKQGTRALLMVLDLSVP